MVNHWSFSFKDDENTPAIFCRYPFLFTLVRKVEVFNVFSFIMKVYYVYNRLFYWMSTFKILHDVVAVLPVSYLLYDHIRLSFHLGFVITDSTTFCAQMGFNVAWSTVERHRRRSPSPGLPANSETNSPGRGHLQTARCSRPLRLQTGAFGKQVCFSARKRHLVASIFVLLHFIDIEGISSNLASIQFGTHKTLVVLRPKIWIGCSPGYGLNFNNIWSYTSHNATSLENVWTTVVEVTLCYKWKMDVVEAEAEAEADCK